MQVDGKSSEIVLRPGTVVAGKYRVERTLAEGGMGLVVAATHLHLEQRVALKFLRGEMASHQWDALARFSREAKAVAQLRSEHVAHVLDAGVTDEGTPYMVMEYLEGRSLAGALQVDGPLDIASTAEYAIQACEGLAEAHAHAIVHRDIKPYNLFLTERSPGHCIVKIVDFGISKFAFSDHVTTGVIVGSPCYMSPEQLRSTASVDHRSDIWSLGATLYELLAGHAAFDASQTLPELVTAILDKPTPSLREARPEVPEGLAAVVERCLAKDRAARFQSAGKVAMALLPFAPARAHVPAERAVSMKPAFVAPSSEPDAMREKASSEGSLAPVSSELGVAGEARSPVALVTLVSAVSPDGKGAGNVEGESPATPPEHGRDVGPGQEAESEVPRIRAPKWVGAAMLASAVAVVFCTILVAAPSGRGKPGGRGTAGAPSVDAPALTAPAAARVEAPAPLASASLIPLPPEPAAGSSQLVELVVRASPSFAKVAVDGEPVGRNPFRASYPKGGEVHRITASAEGYESKSESVSLTSDLVVELSLNRSVWQPPSPPRRAAPAPQQLGSPAKPPATAQPQKPATIQPQRAPIQLPQQATSPVSEVDSAGGRKPLRPIETRDPYGSP